ncbi:hypothetical protein [Hyphomonas sp. CY54-11-8]|uniref:hypothetical protein n=1 Tax=Hyphomonas sp. CY54-11-8 TaxID=1280944 RepID=UPI0004591741|nr:hypothetical protein [Hyphomonas sp. CY54-11-8]KCZ47728.1 hypothetical protein HY17_04430 [Hyphomonas sp. CY54-11-8]
MTKTETLLALAARVEAGETGRELDAEIFVALGWVPSEAALVGGTEPILMVTHPDHVGGTHTPLKITTSLDAIAALTERVLPEGKWEISTGRRCPGEDCWWATAIIGARRYKVHAPTEPAARLAALLRALAEKEKEDG